MRSCSATSVTCQLLPDLQPKASACFSLPSPEVPESYVAAPSSIKMPLEATLRTELWKTVSHPHYLLMLTAHKGHLLRQ